VECWRKWIFRRIRPLSLRRRTVASVGRAAIDEFATVPPRSTIAAAAAASHLCAWYNAMLCKYMIGLFLKRFPRQVCGFKEYQKNILGTFDTSFHYLYLLDARGSKVLQRLFELLPSK
jgi:hypothetical protein